MEQKLVSDVSSAAFCGILSICVFVAFFAFTLLWVATLRKGYLKHMEDLPLSDGETRAADKSQTTQS